MATASVATGPWELVERLRSWAERTPWCEWLELSGSLGRGAGDELSDVDAGIGVLLDGSTYEARRDSAGQAAHGFAPVAASLVQQLGTTERPADHHVVQYTDGRQLSLVVMTANARPGLPPGSVALLDRAGRLSAPFVPPAAGADDDRRREWAFLAWWALCDVAKHAGRGAVWRAVESLHEAQAHAWRLHAAALGVEYPSFGAVSVENAAVAAPAGIEATLPSRATPASLVTAARALAGILTPMTTGHDVGGVRHEAMRRLAAPADR